MKFTTLIPNQFNDGTPVGEKQIQGILSRLSSQFGGITSVGSVSGIWFDDNNTQYTDDTIMVWCVCEIDDYQDAREAVIEIGRELGQKAMYFEVRDFDGVQILNIPE